MSSSDIRGTGRKQDDSSDSDDDDDESFPEFKPETSDKSSANKSTDEERSLKDIRSSTSLHAEKESRQMMENKNGSNNLLQSYTDATVVGDMGDNSVSGNNIPTAKHWDSNDELSGHIANLVLGDKTKSVPKQPVDTWLPMKEIFLRELGCNNRLSFSPRFANRVSGSSNVTKKLIKYASLESHSGCVNALHFNDSGTLLASGGDDLNIVVWNWMESKSFFTFDSGHRSNVFQCKFMPFTGDSHFVTCARDGQIRLADLSSAGICKGTKKLAQHRGAAHKIALLSDSSHVFYTCGEDAVTFEIDLREEKPRKLCVTKEGDHKVELYSIHSNPFKPFEFCVGGRDQFLRIYDSRKINQETNSGILMKLCPRHMLDGENSSNITCAVYSYDGTEVLASYNDDDIYLFDAVSPVATPDVTGSSSVNHLHHYKGHRNSATVKGVNFYGPKSEFVVSGSDCGHIFLWEKETEKIINYCPADEAGVINVLEPHPHLPILATSGLDYDVKVWMPLGEEGAKLEGLDQVIEKNRSDRESSTREPDIDSHMLWVIMRHIRRSTRMQMRNLGEEGAGALSSSDASDADDNDDEEDSDDDEEGHDAPMQCPTS